MRASQFSRWAIALIVVGMLAGCTSFEVHWADGTVVRTSGAPLVSRQDAFEVSHEWLDDATNTLHRVEVRRNTDENANAQVRAMELMFQAGMASAGRGAVAP